MKAYINAGKLSAGHARMLIGQPNPEEMAREIVDRGLNVRQVEALAKERARGSGKAVSKRVRRAPTRSRWSGASPMRSVSTVTIDHRGEGGVLHMRYRSLDQLDDVVRRLEKS